MYNGENDDQKFTRIEFCHFETFPKCDASKKQEMDLDLMHNLR